MKKYYNAITILVLVVFTLFSLRIDLFAEVITQPNQPPSQNAGSSKSLTPARQFQDLLQDTEKVLGEVEAGGDISFGLNQLKANKTDLIRLGVELRLEFSQTKTKLLSQNASSEMLQRHDEFVKKFEEKVLTLLNNLEEIEKGPVNTRAGRIKETKEFLEANIHKGAKRTPSAYPTHKLKQIKRAPRQEARLFLSKDLLVKISGFFCSSVEASEVEITQEIIDLATSLNNQPLQIYQFVRNNIKYEPYYGSLKGALGTLHDKSGNDIDQASLLISLLQAANIQARYVYGQVEIPIERAKSWLGIEDPWRVADILVTYGTPAVTMVKGGQVSAIRIEHCWVEAFIDYVPSRGAIHKQGDTWIPLDPSFKLKNICAGADISVQVQFDKNSYLSKCQKIDNALHFYLNQLGEYVVSNFPDKELWEFSKTESTITENLEILPCVLPYKRISTIVTYTEIPEHFRYKIKVTVTSEGFPTSDMIYEGLLPALYEKRVVLSYKGTQSPYTNPAYTVDLQPTIKIDGIEQVSGEPIGTGETQNVVIDISMPNQEPEKIQNEITAGEFQVLCVNWPMLNSQSMNQVGNRLMTNINTIGPDFLQQGFFSEEVCGDFLYFKGKEYFAQVGLARDLAGIYMQIPVFRDLAYATTSIDVGIDYLFEVPYQINLAGISIDADRNICLVVPKTGQEWKSKEFAILTGYASSSLEHIIWEKVYGPSGVSAVKAIQIANESSIPVYDLDNSNIDIVDTFTISAEVKEIIRNAVNAGNTVKCPQSNITYAGWTGVGYIVMNPITGEGRYEITDISGGTLRTLFMSVRELQDYDTIEKLALMYAITYLTDVDGKPIPDDCTAFAKFAQFLADQFTDEAFEFFFLPALYDLSVYDNIADENIWFLGLLGNLGPRKKEYGLGEKYRPPLSTYGTWVHGGAGWLNTHDEGMYDNATKNIVDTGGYKIYDPNDPDIKGAFSGKKDHFITNAQSPFVCWIVDIERGESSTNDSIYNALGRNFGRGITYWGTINKHQVEEWIMGHLHE